MWLNKRRSSSAPGDRPSQAGQGPADSNRRRNLRDRADDAAAADDHPILEPETGASSDVLRAIEAARQEAARLSGGVDSVHPALDEAPDGDIEFLRSAMVDYEILDRIRHGGQGIVYRACHKKTKRTVAIKILRAGPLATQRQRLRFEREAELTSRLQHANIVTLYDYGLVQGRPYLAMQYVEGLPIDDNVVLHDLPPRETVKLFIEVCRAVSYAHQNGIIHRDLNPSNILVDETGQPQVLDFGLAKDLWADEDAAKFSIAGQVVGTLPYLSPEQAEGADDGIDVRSDIYSLGVVLYGLLTDVMPYPVDGSPQRVRSAIIASEPLPLRKAAALGEPDRLPGTDSINHDLEVILGKALAKNKVERYQSADAFADDLERYLMGDAVEAKVGYRLYMVRKVLRRYRVAVTVAALFMLILTVSSIAITMSLLQARAQRDNARAVARVAQSALNTTLTEVEEAIRPLAGGIDVRDRLLLDVADDLERLRPLIESDIAMEDVLATLREKQGDIALAQGRHGDAAEHYQAFLEMTLSQNRKQAATDEAVTRAVRGSRKLAAVSETRDAHFQQAIEIGETFLRGHPDAQDVPRELCRTHVEFSYYLYGEGRYKPALERADAALTLAMSEVTSAPDDTSWRQLLATAYARSGGAHLKLGNGASGLESLRSSLDLRESLSQQQPANVGLRRELLLSYVGLGTLHRDDGRIGEATQLLLKAVDVGEYLVEVDPTSAVWKRDLYGAHDRLSRLFCSTKELDKAQQHCDVAVRLAGALIESEPGSAEWLRILGFSHILRGRIRSLQEEWHLARDSFDEARTIRVALSSGDPQNPQLRDELAGTHDYLGKCCRKLGQSKQALAHYEEAYAIREALLEAQPNTADRLLGFVLSQMTLATGHLAKDTPEDDAVAADLLVQAEATLHGLHEDGRLRAWEGKYATWLGDIHHNQGLIERRTQKRIETDGVPDQPTAQPSEPRQL